MPALRWDEAQGFDYLRDNIDNALELGVGGFFIRSGPRDAVADLVADLHARTRIPLLMAASAERGAGQLFEGCVGLPPFGALAAGGDLAEARRAARVTARDLRALGFNWVLAPVCDLDLDPGSAIVGARGVHGGASAAAFIGEWIDACQAEGVMACAKHFPGHGRVMVDSHVERGTVRENARTVWGDMLPFRAAIDAGVASLMTAHVSFPALDASGVPATLSEAIITELLRRDMGFDGLLLTDSMDMEGLLAYGGETTVAEGALRAGCDLLLAPMNVAIVARALARSLQHGTLTDKRVREAAGRRERWATWSRRSQEPGHTLDDIMWARQCADRALTTLRGVVPRVGTAVEVIVVDDDADGPWPVPNRAPFLAALESMEVSATLVAEPSAGTHTPVIVAAIADVTAWKNVSGFGVESVAMVERALHMAEAQRRPTLLLLFAHPRHAEQWPGAANVLCAWGSERPMLEAAARLIARPPSVGGR